MAFLFDRSIKCCKCGMVFGIPEHFYISMRQLAEKGTFYCPAGHPQCFASGQSENEKLRLERDRLKQHEAYLEDQLREERESSKRALAVERGRLTKLKNRLNAGVCPCCNRTFQNLQRHMATKHGKDGA